MYVFSCKFRFKSNYIIDLFISEERKIPCFTDSNVTKYLFLLMDSRNVPHFINMFWCYCLLCPSPEKQRGQGYYWGTSIVCASAPVQLGVQGRACTCALSCTHPGMEGGEESQQRGIVLLLLQFSILFLVPDFDKIILFSYLILCVE